MKTGIAFLLVLLGVGGVGGVAAEESTRQWIELLDDTRFEQGFKVWSPVPGQHVREGTMRGNESAAEPKWGLAQWHSRFTLAKTRGELRDDKSVRFFDGAKSVTFFPPSAEADISFGLDAQTEYEGKAPERGAAWPHLLAERDLLAHPRVDELRSIRLQMSFRLVKADVAKPDGFDAQRHTAQFQLYLTVQNQNRSSAGYGDYLWFGVPMYDERYRVPPWHKAADITTSKLKGGTGKFIFSVAGEKYMRASAHDKQWVTIDADLLPMVKESVETAWNRGYLQDSKDWADYRLGGMNLGWEVTGPINVEVQVKDFRLRAERAGE